VLGNITRPSTHSWSSVDEKACHSDNQKEYLKKKRLSQSTEEHRPELESSARDQKKALSASDQK
jgi:hypothetical protein